MGPFPLIKFLVELMAKKGQTQSLKAKNASQSGTWKVLFAVICDLTALMFCFVFIF